MAHQLGMVLNCIAVLLADILRLQGSGCCRQPAVFTHPPAEDGASSKAREPAPRPSSGEATAGADKLRCVFA